MRISLSLSMSTYTPVSYWMGIPLTELGKWLEIASDILKEGGWQKWQKHMN